VSYHLLLGRRDPTPTILQPPCRQQWRAMRFSPQLPPGCCCCSLSAGAILESAFLLASGAASSGSHSPKLCLEEISSGGVSNEKNDRKGNKRNEENEVFHKMCLVFVPLLGQKYAFILFFFT